MSEALPPPALQAGAPPPETEPEGFGDAVQAAALMLALTTALAWVGFQWQRNHEQAAHRFAVDLVERVAQHGDHALVPVWSGWGLGPTSATARRTFQVLRGLGTLAPGSVGQCQVASRFALCRGTRYHCNVLGATPAGPIAASIGLCSTGARMPYTFDSFDLTLPVVGDDHGNRGDVDVSSDGLIRYGTTPPLPEPLPVRRHRRSPPPWL